MTCQMKLIYDPLIFTEKNILKYYEQQHNDLYWGIQYMGYSSVDGYGEDRGLHRLFKLPFESIIEMRLSLATECGMSYETFDRLPFFELLMTIEAHNKKVKKENERQDKENNKMEQQVSNMQNAYQQPKFDMPKFDMPKFNMPSM